MEAILPECIRSGHPDRNPESDQCRSYGDGRDHAWKGWRESVIWGISCRTDPIHHDTDLLRSDLRSNGSDGAVLGKKDTRTIEKVLGMGLSAGLIVAVVFAGAALGMPETLMRIYTSDPEVIAEGVKYLRIVGFSYVFMAVTQVYLNIMRSIERVMVATFIYLISLLMNIVVNAVLIFGLLDSR